MTAPVSGTQFNWSRLSPLQVGRYAEYYSKMEFTLYGFDVYSAEVDDKGIDFVVRKDAVSYYDVQVKSVRSLNYIFFPKSKFEIRPTLFAAIVLFHGQAPPALYLVPSTAWLTSNALFVDRDYGPPKKSPPEWGVNLSRRNLPLLEPYEFSKVVETL